MGGFFALLWFILIKTEHTELGNFVFLKDERYFIMKKNEYSKLSRQDLIELLITKIEENEKLAEKVSQMETELENRKIKLNRAGNIAQAALSLNGIFEKAQEAADEYVLSIKEVDEFTAKTLIDAMYEEAEQERIRLEDETKAHCEELKEDVSKECDKIRQNAQLESVKILENAHLEKTQILNDANNKKKQILDSAKEEADMLVKTASETAKRFQNQARYAYEDTIDECDKIKADIKHKQDEIDLQCQDKLNEVAAKCQSKLDETDAVCEEKLKEASDECDLMRAQCEEACKTEVLNLKAEIARRLSCQ